MSMHWRTLVLGVMCGAMGCSDDGVPATEGSTSGTPTSSDSVTSPSTTGGEMTTGPDDTTGVGPTTGDTGSSDGPGSSSGEPTTGPTDTDSSSGSSGSSDDTGSESGTGTESGTGSETGTSAATDYAGTWEGMCGMIGVSGTLEVEIFDDGTVSGTFAGDDSGTFDGTIDDEGMISTSGNGMVAGACTFEGQLEMDSISGTWSCPTVMCTGTWEASPS